MTRMQLTVDVEPELARRVEIAAASSGKSVSEWIEGTLEYAVEAAHDASGVGEEVTLPSSGARTSRGIDNPPELVGKVKTAAEVIIEHRRELEQEYPDITLPSPGAKLQDVPEPVKLRGGSTMADTVLEDRGER